MSPLYYIAAGLLALIAVWAVVVFNGLVRARNKVDEAWSGVDVQLKRRTDLVPNLVAAVAGYARHERIALERVTEARAGARAAASVGARTRAEAQLTGALAALTLVAEQYPQLMATTNFQQLQAQLAEIENEIAAARQIYNSNVRHLNERVQMFPSSIVARIAAFHDRGFFELELSSEGHLPEARFA